MFAGFRLGAELNRVVNFMGELVAVGEVKAV
jgi:hypothetical protein